MPSTACILVGALALGAHALPQAKLTRRATATLSPLVPRATSQDTSITFFASYSAGSTEAMASVSTAVSAIATTSGINGPGGFVSSSSSRSTGFVANGNAAMESGMQLQRASVNAVLT